MTRAAVFLAAILVAASLGVVAQDNHSTAGSGPAAAGSVQSSTSQTGNDAVNAGSKAQKESSEVADQPAGQDGRAENGQLPQTSTMLPLLGLIGLGSLVAGFFARR